MHGTVGLGIIRDDHGTKSKCMSYFQQPGNLDCVLAYQ